MSVNFKSTKSGLFVQDEPMFKSEIGGPRSYLFIEEFEKGATPQGWTVATSGAGSSVNWAQPYQSGVIGQAFVQCNQAAINNRAGLIFANGRNYILNFTDCVYTILRTKVKNDTGSFTAIVQVGFGNTITPSTVLAGQPQTNFGNTIAFRLDPENRTGENPSLITNWYLFVKKVGASYTSIDTGVPYSSVNFQDLTIMIDNSIPLTPVIRAYIDDVEVATLTDMTNVPLSEPNLAGRGLQPMIWAGTGGFTGGPAITYRNGSFSIYRLWY